MRSSNDPGALCQECNTFTEFDASKLKCLLIGSHHGVLIKIGPLLMQPVNNALIAHLLVDISVLLCPLSLLHSRPTLSIYQLRAGTCCQQLKDWE